MKNLLIGLLLGSFATVTLTSSAWTYSEQYQKDKNQYIQYVKCKQQVAKGSCACEELNPF